MDLSVIMEFRKLKELTTDKSLICKVVRYSKLVQLDEEGNRIKRVTPLPDPKTWNADNRTVYVVG